MIIRVFLTIPVSTASVERCFSDPRQIENIHEINNVRLQTHRTRFNACPQACSNKLEPYIGNF